MDKVALVTGGRKGLGYSIAKGFAGLGCRVYEISRHDQPNEGVTHIDGDVTDPSSVEAAVRQVLEREGRIDILVCNAGTVISGAIEFTRNEDIKRIMDLNFFGMVNTVRAVLPSMREARSGRIVCLSSMAAPFPVPFQAYYCASKAAIAAFTFSLGNEVKPYGISVCAVMPGDTKTEPIRTKLHQGDDLYGGRISSSVAVMERDESRGMDPDKVGLSICRIALRRRVKPYNAIGPAYKVLYFLKRVFPSRFAQQVVGMMYK